MSRGELIRAAWAARTAHDWNPETHGRGLEPLHISVSGLKNVEHFKNMKPLAAPPTFEFWFETAKQSGRGYDAIVGYDETRRDGVEGVVVEKR
ncbi:MAG TPA: hypothetical protein VKP67_06325 [Xanthobacteraceae bacterium]|nr:hypothetical protein [Xanthobacteraceae bacterium]